MGYLELDIEGCGVVVPKRGVLVVQDSDERKGDVCVACLELMFYFTCRL